jgi:hypothetical protein
MSWTKLAFSFLTALMALNGIESVADTVPQHRRVYLVVLENHSYEQVIGSSSMPYLNELARNYALTTAMYANSRPSIGNYFVMTTGEEIANHNSFNATVSVRNLVRELREEGKSWVAYLQSLPRTGYTGGPTGHYRQHHNPFAYFSDVRNSDTQRQRLKPLSHWNPSGEHPSFVYLLPDNAHNAHDCPAGDSSCSDWDKRKAADDWLKRYIKPLIDSGRLADDGLLIITWDEGRIGDTRQRGGRIATVLVGPRVRRAHRSSASYRHEHLLNTIMQALDLEGSPGVTRYTKLSFADMFY